MILLVSLPTEKIDKDFMQSYWLPVALQFVPTKKNKPNWNFTVVCHGQPTEKRNSTSVSFYNGMK